MMMVVPSNWAMWVCVHVCVPGQEGESEKNESSRER